MNKLEQGLGRAIYDAMMAKAAKLNFVDQMVLMNALNSRAPFESIPATQQRLFVEVGMAAVRALQAMNSGNAG